MLTRILSILAIAFLTYSCTNEKTIPLIPIEDFFENAQVKDFQISPGGDYYSYLAPYKNRMNIFVRPINDTVAIRITSVEDRDIKFYSWKSNERIVYLQDNHGDENFHLFSTSFNGTGEKDLTPYDSTKVKILDALKGTPSEMLIQMNKRRKDVYDVYKINIDTGDTTLLALNPGNITSWFTDHNKTIRLAIITDGVNQTLLYRETANSTWDTIKQTTYKETFTPLLFSFDNSSVYMLSNINRDKTAVIEYSLTENKEIDILYEDSIVDAGRLEYTLLGKRPTAVVFAKAKMGRYYLDTQTANLYDTLEAKVPNYLVTIISNNKDEDIYILKYKNDKCPGVYYSYFRKNDSLVLLGDEMKKMDHELLADMQPIQFQSRDGLTIHGYLTLPVNAKPQNLPMVVLPHGGPKWRDFWKFNPRVQFLANRGYAVLQVNFRGSISYGRAFKDAGDKQWGRAMQDDITDGVQHIINQGIADPNRIAIMGGSYGGYATLAGLAFTPDLYKCGVDIVGVSNIFTLLESIPPYWEPYLEMLYEQIGHPVKDSLLLRKVSPVFHADKIKAPLLIFQGAKDPRVKKAESDQMVKALQDRGIKVPYIVKENEGHGFKNQENKMEMYQIIETFLKENL